MADELWHRLLVQLRREAVADAKTARASFQSILDGPVDTCESILDGASGPGDGRIRQVVAMVYKSNLEARSLESWLRRWLDTEQDEFTRNAIEAALASRAPVAARPTGTRLSTNQIIEAYRYVSDRLCHRIRNPLALPSSQLARLQSIVSEVRDPQLKQDLMDISASLQTGLQRISRTVDFDISDDYLVWQDICLVEWLESASRDFEPRYGAAQLVVSCDPTVRPAKVRATKFVLDTVFGNLWANAVQASDPPNALYIQGALTSQPLHLQLTIGDAGPGFTDTHFDTAFQQAFSTKLGNRGRGLLEIAEGVSRLHGTVSLSRVQESYRIVMRLPVAPS